MAGGNAAAARTMGVPNLAPLSYGQLPFFNVLAAPSTATGNGTTDDRAALLADQATALSLGLLQLLLPAGTYRLASNTTFTANLWLLPGAVLAPDTGAIITLSGGVTAAPTQQIFTTGAGTFRFGATDQLYAEWWGAKGDAATDDIIPINAAATCAGLVAESGTFGATLKLLSRTYKITASIVAGAGVSIVGAGARATRLLTNFADFAIKIGTTAGALAYGCAVRDLSINMTNASGSGLTALGTSGFDAQRLYIEGVVGGACNGVFVDGSNAANILTTLSQIFCNHVQNGFYLGTSGAQVTTSVTGTQLAAVTDLTAGSAGLRVDAGHGLGSQFFGCDFETCNYGAYIAGSQVKLVAVRFEGNTTDLALIAGATGNEFVACTNLNNISNASGLTTNTFLENKNGSNLPVNNVIGPVSNGLTFGPNTSSLQGLANLVIANNATGTTPASASELFLLYDSGITANNALVLVSQSTGANTVVIVAQSGTTFTVVPGSAGKFNLSVSGGNLNIENLVGNTTIRILRLLNV